MEACPAARRRTCHHGCQSIGRHQSDHSDSPQMSCGAVWRGLGLTATGQLRHASQPLTYDARKGSRDCCCHVGVTADVDVGVGSCQHLFERALLLQHHILQHASQVVSCPCRVAQLQWEMRSAQGWGALAKLCVEASRCCSGRCPAAWLLSHHCLTGLSELPTWTYCFFCPGTRECATYT